MIFKELIHGRKVLVSNRRVWKPSEFLVQSRYSSDDDECRRSELNPANLLFIVPKIKQCDVLRRCGGLLDDGKVLVTGDAVVKQFFNQRIQHIGGHIEYEGIICCCEFFPGCLVPNHSTVVCQETNGGGVA